MSSLGLLTGGTISVTNDATAVTGSGTAFTQAFVGSLLIANGEVAVVSDIASDTALTISDGWAGTTISGGDYAIVLISQAHSLSAQNQKRLQELLEQFSFRGALLTGTGAPATALGYDGDVYIDTDTADFYSKASGSWSSLNLGISTAVTSAEAAQTAAEAAQTAAEAAQTGAEAAETNAESAVTAAEAARDLAEGYRDTAEGHKDDAETAAATTTADLASFQEKYLGEHATDGDANTEAGGTPTAGALYWNTTGDVLKVYSGGSWNVVVATNVLTRTKFTATASQTTFVTGGYTAGSLGVFMNGVLLDPDDYTATDGTDIVLDTGAEAGDILEVWIYDGEFQSNAHYTKVEADALLADKVSQTASTGSAILPVGTTAQRDGSPSAGYLRWNSDDDSAEVYDGSDWSPVGGGGYNHFRNLIINGDMQVNQEGDKTGAGNGEFGCDLAKIFVGGAAEYDLTQVADGPPGFANCLEIKVATADASLAASDFSTLTWLLEGRNLQHAQKGLASAKPWQFQIWTKTDKAGTYPVELRDLDNGRHVCGTITVAGAETWQQATISFPADTTGAFDNDSSSSLILYIWLSAGTDLTSGTAPSSWSTFTAANRAADLSVNFADTVGNYMRITGVQLEVGDAATEFEHLPYDVQLRRCKRYYQAGSMGFLTYGGIGGSVGQTLQLAPEMRSTPTIAQTNTFAFNCSTTPANGNITATGFRTNRAVTSTGSVQFDETWTADARL